MNRILAVLVAVLVAATAACSGTVSPSPQAFPTGAPATATPASPASTVPPGMIREVRADVARAVPGPADAFTAVVDADAAFAFDLYARLVADADGDLFLSPYSISTALSMTYAGARGSTADQLARALWIDLASDAWHAGRNALELDLAEPPAGALPKDVVPLTLEPTNAIFGQDGFRFESAYLETLAANYGAGLQALDFVAEPEAGRAAINAWVADRTRDRIPELLPRGTIDSLTRVVLVNAIYFKATWVTAFDPERTTNDTFRLLDGSTVQVPTMHGFLTTGQADGHGWQAVRLPYVGASMLVIVPDERRFTDVESGLDLAFLRDVEARLEPTQVTLALPRWESETSAPLKEPLRALGVVDVFDPEAADLTGIWPDPDDLYVSSVIHQANVSVDEAGTEAAAATAVDIGVTSLGPDRRATVTVDRPWIYAIVDDSTGEILFLGRVMEPSAG